MLAWKVTVLRAWKVTVPRTPCMLLIAPDLCFGCNLAPQVMGLISALTLGVVVSVLTSVDHEEMIDAIGRFATVDCDGDIYCDNPFYGVYGCVDMRKTKREDHVPVGAQCVKLMSLNVLDHS